MPLHKPQDMSVVRWAFSGFDLKTIITVTVMLAGAHFAQSNRITVVEQKAPALAQRLEELERRTDVQREALQKVRESKLELSTYYADQRILADQLRAIQDGQGRIETILMQGHVSRP